MTTEIHEEQPSRSIRVGNDGASQRRQYWMKNYTESEQAWLALRQYSPATIYIGGFELNRTSVEVTIEHSDPEQTLYRGVVEYLSPTAGGATDKAGKGGGGGGGEDTDLPKNGEGGKKQDEQSDGVEEEDPAKIFFTFGSKQITLTEAFQQDRWEADAEGDFKQARTTYSGTQWPAINKDGDDVAPEGVSIPDATMFMHVRFIKSLDSMTPQYYQELRDSLYNINSLPFGYWKAGSVQFQGVELSPMKSGDYKVEYKFEIGRQDAYDENGRAEQYFTTDPNPPGSGLYFRSSPQMNANNMGWSPFNYTWLSYNTIGRDTKVGGVGDTEVDTFIRRLDSVNNAQVYLHTPDFGWERNVVFGAMNRAAKKLDPKKWVSYVNKP